MPLMRRRRPLLRAAAVGGGAYMAGKHRANTQAEQQQNAYYEGQQSMAQAPPAAPAPAAAPAADAGGDYITRLKQLGELHDQGILTDDEFAQEKARVLGAN
ncbi:MAG: SHOCT domain-containing protein [Solirubrobacteraceae bacterium]